MFTHCGSISTLSYTINLLVGGILLSLLYKSDELKNRSTRQPIIAVNSNFSRSFFLPHSMQLAISSVTSIFSVRFFFISFHFFHVAACFELLMQFLHTIHFCIFIVEQRNKNKLEKQYILAALAKNKNANWSDYIWFMMISLLHSHQVATSHLDITQRATTTAQRVNRVHITSYCFHRDSIDDFFIVSFHCVV